MTVFGAMQQTPQSISSTPTAPLRRRRLTLQCHYEMMQQGGASVGRLPRQQGTVATAVLCTLNFYRVGNFLLRDENSFRSVAPIKVVGLTHWVS